MVGSRGVRGVPAKPEDLMRRRRLCETPRLVS